MTTFVRSGCSLFRSGRLIGTWPKGEDPDPQACGQRLELDGVPLSEIVAGPLDLRRAVTRHGYPDYGPVLVEHNEPGEAVIAAEQPRDKTGEMTIHCHSLRREEEEG